MKKLLLLALLILPINSIATETMIPLDARNNGEFITPTFPKSELVETIKPYDLFDQVQVELMIIVHQVWSEIGYPETGQAILLQESIAGTYGKRRLKNREFIFGDTNLPYTERAYGVMQVRLPAARDALHHNPILLEEYFGRKSVDEVIDEEIMMLLVMDDYFNIQISARYFEYNMKLVKRFLKRMPWSYTLVSYNAGFGVAADLKHPTGFKYVRSIRKHIKKRVRSFNNYYGLDQA